MFVDKLYLFKQEQFSFYYKFNWKQSVFFILEKENYLNSCLKTSKAHYTPCPGRGSNRKNFIFLEFEQGSSPNSLGEQSSGVHWIDLHKETRNFLEEKGQRSSQPQHFSRFLVIKIHERILLEDSRTVGKLIQEGKRLKDVHDSKFAMAGLPATLKWLFLL